MWKKKQTQHYAKPSLTRYTRKKKNTFVKRWFVRLNILLLPALGITWVIKSFFIFSVFLENSSMEPTLARGSKIFFSYVTDKDQVVQKAIQRGSIVYINSSSKGLKMVCRVIGLPQETIYIKDQAMYINDTLTGNTKYQIIRGKRILPQEISVRDNILPEKIPENHYFCLFDNRRMVNDSRTWGSFSLSDIQGIAFSKSPLGNLL